MGHKHDKIDLTKTDFARLLDKSSERFPEVIPLWETYMEKCARARQMKVACFGHWLRANKPKIFNKLYRQALKMDGLLEEIYDGTTDSEIPAV